MSQHLMKYKIIIIIFSFLVSFSGMKAEDFIQKGIDTVFSFKPGEGQNSGQSSEYFPKNIFGLPDTLAREDFQSSTPENILSLGLGGEIIVGFKDFVITDGPGSDFTIFENAFKNPATGNIFAEPGLVSVSQDGINFIDFPFDSLSLKGCAGITPTYGNKNPFNPQESGGDKFDLADIGLNSIKYIKIKDICKMILDNPNHPFYDPIITGFDLDAVVGLHLTEEKQTASVGSSLQDYSVVETALEITIKTQNKASVKIFDCSGQEIYSTIAYDFFKIQKSNFTYGIYFLQIIDGPKIQTQKILVY